MRETRKARKKPIPSNAGYAISGRILVAEDNKNSVIFKPFFLDDLQSTVQRVLDPRYGEQGLMRALQRPPTGEILAHAEPGKEAG